MTCTTACIRPTPSQAHCPVCHNTWSGPTLFDAHRRGPLGARTCTPPQEMTDRGSKLKRDAAGVWRSGAARPATGSGEPETACEPVLVAEPAPGIPDGLASAYLGEDA